MDIEEQPSKSEHARMEFKIIVSLPDGREIERIIHAAPPGIELNAPNSEDLGKRKGKSKVIGQCIYCSSKAEPLSKEHVVPFGLCPIDPYRDLFVLQKASCERCRKITSDFEGVVLGGEMKFARIGLNLRSYSDHANVPTTAPVKLTENGIEEVVNIPLNEYPALLYFPIFLAAHAQHGIAGREIQLKDVYTILFGQTLESFASKYAGKQFELMETQMHPIEFAKMIAKIAYGVAYSEGKLDLIRGTSSVLPSILGEKDMGNYVGTLPYPNRRVTRVLHNIAIDENKNLGLLIGYVQLFAFADSPTYYVILGNLK